MLKPQNPGNVGVYISKCQIHTTVATQGLHVALLRVHRQHAKGVYWYVTRGYVNHVTSALQTGVIGGCMIILSIFLYAICPGCRYCKPHSHMDFTRTEGEAQHVIRMTPTTGI